jgi:hypothetical protein
MEIWDADGRVFNVENSDWAEPVLPDSEIQEPVRFEIAPDALGLELVLGPGEPEEVHIPLPEAV